MLELIGRYRIHEQIGEGAMADVYRAHDPHIDRALAIKVLKPEYREDREYSTRFLREARAAGALSHPSIVTVFDVGEVDGYPFIVMELLDGEPLSEVLKRGPLPPSQVIQIGMQLADALDYAHGQGVIHRDVKPSNVILSPDGRTLKLLDFGIAQLAEHDPLFEDESCRTQIGQVLGTPRYMSPEQALGREMDGRSDIYSLGVVLYETLSVKRAFPGGNAATLTAQIVNVDPIPLTEAAPHVPRGLQFIVHKAMAKQPTQRFADAGRMTEALRRELAVAETIANEAAQQRRYLPLQVRLTLLLALVTALVLAAAVGTVLVRQREAMRQVALTSGTAISAFVANNAALRAVENASLPPEQQDWVPTQAFIKNASADANIRGLIVTDADGVVRAATNTDLIGKPYRTTPSEQPIATRDGIAIKAAEQGRSFRFVRPILYAGRSFGKVDVLLDQATLRSAASLSTWLLILLALVTLGTVALGTFISARLIQAPIARLRGALLELARGNLDFRVSHSRRDEFGELFDDVNLVAQTAQERLDAVEALLLDRPKAPQVEMPATAPATAMASEIALEPRVTSAEDIPAWEPTPAPSAEPASLAPPPAVEREFEPAEPVHPAPALAVATPPQDAGWADRMTMPAEPAIVAAAPIQAIADEPVTHPLAPSGEVDVAPVEDEEYPAMDSEPAAPTQLAPPWPHDDEDRTLVDPEEHLYR